jgi:hypothetical protein
MVSLNCNDDLIPLETAIERCRAYTIWPDDPKDTVRLKLASASLRSIGDVVFSRRHGGRHRGRRGMPIPAKWWATRNESNAVGSSHLVILSNHAAFYRSKWQYGYRSGTSIFVEIKKISVLAADVERLWPRSPTAPEKSRLPPRKRGRPSAVRERVKAEMRSVRDDLPFMKEVEMEARFRASRDTCRKAYEELMSENVEN